MDADKTHITNITKQDLREIAAAANAYGGEGIDVKLTADGLEISIDKNQLAYWIKYVVAGNSLK